MSLELFLSGIQNTWPSYRPLKFHSSGDRERCTTHTLVIIRHLPCFRRNLIQSLNCVCFWTHIYIYMPRAMTRQQNKWYISQSYVWLHLTHPCLFCFDGIFHNVSRQGVVGIFISPANTPPSLRFSSNPTSSKGRLVISKFFPQLLPSLFADLKWNYQII
jgi:hypothetical protein